MNRKMSFVCGLVGFFLMWGVFGFAAAAPRGEADLQPTLQPVENTPILPAETEPAGIPITGATEPAWIEVVGFYGLIGLAAMFLILVVLPVSVQRFVVLPNELALEEP